MTPEELAKAEIEAMARAIAIRDSKSHCGYKELAAAAHAAAAKVREEAGYVVARRPLVFGGHT